MEDDGWNDLTPMTLVTDCKSIYDTVHKDGQHISDKASVIHAVLLRQMLSTRASPKTRLLWVPTRHQIADGLTKEWQDEGAQRTNPRWCRFPRRGGQARQDVRSTRFSYQCEFI